MRKVITVHGVGFWGGQGPWQAVIAKVIEPHFDCDTYKYSYYRWFGLLSAVFEPFVLFPASLALFLFTVFFRSWPILIAGILTVLVFASILARVRRKRAWEELKESRFKNPLQLKPHVIAHSMGTQLIGTVLNEAPSARVGRLILAGCVLPRDYSWNGAAEGYKVDHVRNEVGRKDMVPLFAKATATVQLLPGFGSAGRSGFLEVDGLIHTLLDPNGHCKACVPEGIKAPIHNVIGPFRHSGVLTSEYASAFWLPWLWGIDAVGYARWIELCLSAAQHYKAHDWKSLRLAEEELLHGIWDWADNQSLETYLLKQIRQHPRSSPGKDQIGTILLKIYTTFDIACKAHQDRATGWEREILSLNPVVCVTHALDSVVG